MCICLCIGYNLYIYIYNLLKKYEYKHKIDEINYCKYIIMRKALIKLIS